MQLLNFAPIIHYMPLVIDIGNTAMKMGVFEDGQLQAVKATGDVTISSIREFASNQKKTDTAIICSVVSHDRKINSFLKRQYDLIELNHSTPVPIKNKYSTPETLGPDRLAIAVGASSLYSGCNLLVLGAGTCITFDLITAEGIYLGGSISPGINMRFNALNTFTGKLPLIEGKKTVPLTGNSTKSSIESGVLNGILLETEGIIGEYRQRFKRLKVLVTGGDAPYFVKNLKSRIFAVPNLVLYGLNSISEYNVRK